MENLNAYRQLAFAIVNNQVERYKKLKDYVRAGKGTPRNNWYLQAQHKDPNKNLAIAKKELKETYEWFDSEWCKQLAQGLSMTLLKKRLEEY